MTVNVLTQRVTVVVSNDTPAVTVTAPGPQGPAGVVIYDGGGPSRGAGNIAIDCGEVT